MQRYDAVEVVVAIMNSAHLHSYHTQANLPVVPGAIQQESHQRIPTFVMNSIKYVLSSKSISPWWVMTHATLLYFRFFQWYTLVRYRG